MTSDNENTWTIVTDNKGITFSNNKIPFKECYNGGLTMTYEEALKECREWFNSDGIGELDGVAFNIAINSLEKQIPKKPKVRGYGIHDEEYDDYHEETRYYCPTCVRRTGVLDAESEIPCGIGKQRGWYSHCNHCGQAIDWSE